MVRVKVLLVALVLRVGVLLREGERVEMMGNGV